LLGGLGLILGTIGLGVVMLRNIYERRGELALLRALGLSKNTLGKMVLSENLALLIGGLLIGLFSALAAVAPHILSQPTTIPWASLTLTLLGVLVAGLLAGLLAVVSTTRLPLLPALRSE
jgi:putative ABC transport system permease protein